MNRALYNGILIALAVIGLLLLVVGALIYSLSTESDGPVNEKGKNIATAMILLTVVPWLIAVRLAKRGNVGRSKRRW